MPRSASTHESVYVQILNESVTVFRPVTAQQVDGKVYDLLESDGDSTGEIWEFPLGSRVICERRTLDGGERLVAVELS